jgi:hypothetical protein
MKLCPQCDFIYEDEQGFCDMDGKELVYNPSPIVSEQALAPLSRVTIDLPTRKRSRRLPVLIMAGVALAGGIPLVYLAQTHQSPSKSSADTAIQSSVQPPTRDADVPASSDSATAVADPGQAIEQTSEQPSDQAASVTPRAALTNPGVASGDASAALPSGNGRGSVILRLTNGATITADDAWAGRNGFWYRQGGVVTFLKRNQVKSIERPGSRLSQPKPTTSNKEQRSLKSDKVASQNSQAEPSKPKKESGVVSFLKKTGRILKRPFKS